MKNLDQSSKKLPDGALDGDAALDGGRGSAGDDGRAGVAGNNRPNAPPFRKKRRRKRRRGRKVYAKASDNLSVETPAPPPQAEPVQMRRNRPVVPTFGPGGRTRSYRGSDVPAYAALDLGTNNCRLLVAIPTRPGQFRVIDAFSRIVRLGEGLSTAGRLSVAAMERAVEALKICHDKLANRSLKRARMIATEACRSAENGHEFLQRVREEAGLELEIVDRQTEARLAVSGCGPLVERGTEAVVLFDIGGGSSEIALIDISRKRLPGLAEHIVAWTSLPVGVVSLAERFGGRHVTPEIFDAMTREVTGMLENFADGDRLQHLTSGPGFHLLGTSGTVTTLAGIHLELPRYDRRRVDGVWMNAKEVSETTQRLLGWPFHERVANPCIGADRADLVLAGCAILEAIRLKWPSERLRVADRGLREGILTELMARDGVWRRRQHRQRPMS